MSHSKAITTELFCPGINVNSDIGYQLFPEWM